MTYANNQALPANIGDTIMVKVLGFTSAGAFMYSDDDVYPGIVEGRDWCGDYVLSYTVRMTESGERRHVNAKTLESGHGF